MSYDNDSHYVAAFTQTNERGEQRAVCGEFIPLGLVVVEGKTPRCWGCAAWLHSLDAPPRQKPEHPARVLALISESTPWGSPLEAA